MPGEPALVRRLLYTQRPDLHHQASTLRLHRVRVVYRRGYRYTELQVYAGRWLFEARRDV